MKISEGNLWKYEKKIAEISEGNYEVKMSFGNLLI